MAAGVKFARLKLPADAKWIEFDPPDACLLLALREGGFQRRLAVVRTERQRAAIGERHPAALSEIAVSATSRVVRNNNADVLVLSGSSPLALWQFRNFRHAQYVAWRLSFGAAVVLAALACLVQIALRRICWCGVVSFMADGKKQRLLLFRVHRPRQNVTARRYVPHSLGISGLIARLNDKHVTYAVLRWFEELPALPVGEDLDLLVDDSALGAVHALLDEGPGIQPCDVYSVTGLPGADYNRMPYFPPHAAAALLTEATTHASGAKVPSPLHHFLTLAYHAIYHKGPRSGLPTRRGNKRRRASNLSSAQPEHDYVGALRALAERLDKSVPLTIEDLDEYLQTHGWKPPRDMLARLAKRRPDLRRLLGQQEQGPDDPGLAVFLIRQTAVERSGLPLLAQLIEHEGFAILKMKMLTENESRLVGRSIRGGNWGRGPWPACGGPPAAVIVVYDAEPIPVSWWTRRRFPELTNARLLCKSKLRDAFNHTLPRSEHINALHSSDNGHEARDYIQIIMPEMFPEIDAQIARFRAGFRTDEPVVFQLSNYRRRAKTEVVRFGNRLAVKKTFKPHQRSYCQREARAMKYLSQTVQAIPPLLAADGESVFYPYYEDVLKFRRSSGRLLPLAVAKEAIAALRAVYDAGHALIDAHPENVIVDRQHGLKLIDFEFLYAYEHKPPTFEASYDIAGCPADFFGSQPDGGAKCYARHWQPYIGLSLRSLLHDPTWLQHAKRAVYYVIASPRLLPRRLREIVMTTWQRLARRVSEPCVQPMHEPAERTSVPRRRAA